MTTVIIIQSLETFRDQAIKAKDSRSEWEKFVINLGNTMYSFESLLLTDLHTIWKSSMCANEDLIILSLNLLINKYKKTLHDA